MNRRALSQSQPHRNTSSGLFSHFPNYSETGLRYADAFFPRSPQVHHPEADMDHMPEFVAYIDVGG
eukprot:6450044-Karenia_brevis.AAC.1